MAEGLPSRDVLFGLLFEEVPCYACILDPELNILSVNRRCRENFATPFTRRCYQVFKGRTEGCDDCPAVTTFKTGQVSESREIVTDRAGREMHVICRTAPIKNEDDEVTAVMHMSVREGEGEKLRQDMTAFDTQVGAVSHGIKGLLTAMAGGFYLWDSGLEKNRPDRLQTGTGIVRRNFLRLHHLAHSVLYYIRDRRLHPEALDGVSLLKAIAQDLEDDARFAEARIELEGNMPANAPLTADRRALTSALTNLIVSALDDCYADRREKDHCVTLYTHKIDGFTEFQVADNAMGMEAEAMEKVFSLFFNPKGIEAAGVGLYITNKLARLHAGSVQIESELGKGTRYTLRIPD